MSKNILGHDPSRPDRSYKSIHFWPEVARIVCAMPNSGDAERLAWIAPADKIDGPGIVRSVEGSDVGIDRDGRPMLVENGTAIFIALAESRGLHSNGFKPKTEPSDP
jgi:hypothetical protein